MAVSAFSCVEPSNIGEGRDGVDVFASFCARKQEKKFHCFSQKQKKSLLKEKQNKTTIRYDNIS